MKTFILQIARIKLLLFMMMTLSTMSYSQSGNYYSLKNGDYFDSNLWGYNSQVNSCSCSPDDDGLCTITIPSNKTIHISNVITTICGMYIGSNSAVIVESGGSLTLLGNSSIIGNGNLQIDAGAYLYIGGNLNLQGNGNVLNNGNTDIHGDLTFSGSATFCGTGILNVLGSILGGAPCVTTSSSINSLQQKSTITFFPNPNKGELSVLLPGFENKNASLVLRNSLGKTVFSENFNVNVSGENKISTTINELTPGIYFCTLIVDENAYTQRIIMAPN